MWRMRVPLRPNVPSPCLPRIKAGFRWDDKRDIGGTDWDAEKELRMLALKPLDLGESANQSSAPAPAAPLRHPGCGSHPKLRWYCVQTMVGREQEARDRLAEQAFEVLLPLGARVMGNGIFIGPLFGPYLFVRFDVTRPGWKRIGNTRGVKRLFGAEAPTPIRDDVIEAVRSMPTDRLEGRSLVGPVQRGHGLRVTQGPDRGCRGICLDVVRGTATVMLCSSGGPKVIDMPARWCLPA